MTLSTPVAHKAEPASRTETHLPTPPTSTSIIPGLVLAGAAALVAMGVGSLVPVASPMLVAIVLGFAAVNLGWLPTSAKPGLAIASRRLLRIGVALLGVQLVLTDILALGAGMLLVIVAVVAIGIVATLGIGSLLGIGLKQRLLIACGFSICGAAAVAAVDGVIDPEERETATAVALVVVFGTLMIPAVPLLAGMFGLSGDEAGLWAGASIHEVAQVVAAGGAIGSSALALAVVVKLGRVLMLGPVVAVLGLVQRRGGLDRPADVKRPPLVPLFIIGFIALAALRTTGVLPDIAVHGAKSAQTVLLAMAMFALGCGVHIKSLRTVGPRPLLLAALSTLVVATTALVGVLLVA